MPPTNRLLFESPRPGKIRAVTWFSAAVMAFSIPCAYFTLTQMTRVPLEPELAPLGSRIAMAGFIAVLGIGFFAGMLFYLTLYTTRLTQVAGTDLVQVETLRLFGRHVRSVPVSQIASTSYHHGKLNIPGGVSVDAPWYWVSARGSRGFLLDAKGQFFNRAVLAKILSADGRGHAEA